MSVETREALLASLPHPSKRSASEPRRCEPGVMEETSSFYLRNKKTSE